jgi:hypothetical protein
MTNLIYKGTGSTLSATEWNVLANKLTSGADSIYTGSVVVSGAAGPMVLGPFGNGGSPVNWNMTMLMGSNITSAASVCWVVFGIPFMTIPSITCSSFNKDGTANTIAGSIIKTGSFLAVSTVASSQFSWMGCG